MRQTQSHQLRIGQNLIEAIEFDVHRCHYNKANALTTRGYL